MSLLLVLTLFLLLGLSIVEIFRLLSNLQQTQTNSNPNSSHDTHEIQPANYSEVEPRQLGLGLGGILGGQAPRPTRVSAPVTAAPVAVAPVAAAPMAQTQQQGGGGLLGTGILGGSTPANAPAQVAQPPAAGANAVGGLPGTNILGGSAQENAPASQVQQGGGVLGTGILGSSGSVSAPATPMGQTQQGSDSGLLGTGILGGLTPAAIPDQAAQPVAAAPQAQTQQGGGGLLETGILGGSSPDNAAGSQTQQGSGLLGMGILGGSIPAVVPTDGGVIPVAAIQPIAAAPDGQPAQAQGGLLGGILGGNGGPTIPIVGSQPAGSTTPPTDSGGLLGGVAGGVTGDVTNGLLGGGLVPGAVAGGLGPAPLVDGVLGGVLGGVSDGVLGGGLLPDASAGLPALPIPLGGMIPVDAPIVGQNSPGVSGIDLGGLIQPLTGSLPLPLAGGSLPVIPDVVSSLTGGLQGVVNVIDNPVGAVAALTGAAEAGGGLLGDPPVVGILGPVIADAQSLAPEVLGMIADASEPVTNLVGAIGNDLIQNVSQAIEQHGQNAAAPIAEMTKGLLDVVASKVSKDLLCTVPQPAGQYATVACSHVMASLSITPSVAGPTPSDPVLAQSISVQQAASAATSLMSEAQKLATVLESKIKDMICTSTLIVSGTATVATMLRPPTSSPALPNPTAVIPPQRPAVVNPAGTNNPPSRPPATQSAQPNAANPQIQPPTGNQPVMQPAPVVPQSNPTQNRPAVPNQNQPGTSPNLVGPQPNGAQNQAPVANQNQPFIIPSTPVGPQPNSSGGGASPPGPNQAAAPQPAAPVASQNQPFIVPSTPVGPQPNSSGGGASPPGPAQAAAPQLAAPVASQNQPFIIPPTPVGSRPSSGGGGASPPGPNQAAAPQPAAPVANQNQPFVIPPTPVGSRPSSGGGGASPPGPNQAAAPQPAAPVVAANCPRPQACQACAVCPLCAACPTGAATPRLPPAPERPKPNPAFGPCPGEGYSCSECLDGWFCPPRQTPAVACPCGFGWPCVHCKGGWYCVPLPTPTPAVCPAPLGPYIITTTVTQGPAPTTDVCTLITGGLHQTQTVITLPMTTMTTTVPDFMEPTARPGAVPPSGWAGILEELLKAIGNDNDGNGPLKAPGILPDSQNGMPKPRMPIPVGNAPSNSMLAKAMGPGIVQGPQPQRQERSPTSTIGIQKMRQSRRRDWAVERGDDNLGVGDEDRDNFMRSVCWD
jgi:hypothetical protein